MEFLPTINHSLADIIRLIYIEEITHFRFNKRKNISKKFDLDLKEVKHSEIPYCLTNGVSNNPHIIDRKNIKEALRFVEISKNRKELRSNYQIADTRGNLWWKELSSYYFA